MTKADLATWLRRPDRTLVMGVVNVTPDSFSDGGQFASPPAAIDHARAQIAAGADLIDIGGESTRPGSHPVPEEEQIRRIVPVIRALAGGGTILSIDTTRAAVAAAALDAGAAMVNDISAGRDDPAMFPLLADREAPVILMHMQGTPLTMQLEPHYADVVGEIKCFLAGRIHVATQAGIHVHRLLVDPGIGFGKTDGHNLELLRRLDELAELGRPIVIGTSRKAFIGRITNEPQADQRLFGTAATISWSIAHGAGIVRVHDVGPMKQVSAMIDAIVGRRMEDRASGAKSAGSNA